jgi:hypothetical protein
MRKRHTLVFGIVLLVLMLALAACQSYTTSGSSTSSQQGANGGEEQVRAAKANGTSTQSLEDLPNGGGTLDAEVSLSVGKGSFKIELLGPDDQVTLTLEARDGESVSGSGSMAVDSFGEASYRVTAVEAEDIEYSLVYVYR